VKVAIAISLDEGGEVGVDDRESGGERKRSGRYMFSASTYVVISGFVSMSNSNSELTSNSPPKALPDSALIVDLSGFSPISEGPTTSATDEASARRAREKAARRAGVSGERVAIEWWVVGKDNVGMVVELKCEIAYNKAGRVSWRRRVPRASSEP